jgi:ribosomal-protein-serine acetyltransferase
MINEASIGIRRFHTADVPSLLLAARESMADLQQWMTWCRPDYSLADSSKFVLGCDGEWEAGRRYSFVICDRRNCALLGSIGLSGVNWEHRFANVGYWVRSSCTGRGVASAALRLAARFAFDELQLQRLELIIAVGNHASMRVAEKAGAYREGVLRQRVVLEGKPASALLYSLVAGDLAPCPDLSESGRRNACSRAEVACALS